MTERESETRPVDAPPPTAGQVTWAGDPRAILNRLIAGDTLARSEARAVFSGVLNGAFDSAQIASLLTSLAARGPSVDELVGGALAMRAHVNGVVAPAGLTLVDTCGTGGTAKTFNVSTLSAIVVSAALPGRVGVAKHGGKSRTGRGSAELMSALGVNIDCTPEQEARCLREIGLCFCFAPRHHPAMRHAAPVRASLGFPTIFNLLGPLTNPAGVDRQLIGAMSESTARLLAGALSHLGTPRSMVAWSRDGLDELSVSAPALTYVIEHEQVSEREVDPRSLGLPHTSVASLIARDLDNAVQIAREVLLGQPSPQSDMVALNAGAALFIAGAVSDVGAGVELARKTVRDGLAALQLRALIRLSHEPT